MKGFWKCRICDHENSALDHECANNECGERQRNLAIINGAKYAAAHGIKRPPPDDTWKDWPPEEWRQ